ncbi:MAG: hypothetical protein J7M17_02740 [Anaerolineae bacterium]|nr:hypothetical protein [Anaerolineae bacterium]
MFGVGGALVHEAAQAADAVVFQVKGMLADESPVFGDEQEQKAVDQAQKLVVELFGEG